MTQEEAFVQDILEHPEDDTPRLIYADWLEEQGQPERAELIRVQCRLARLEEDDLERLDLKTREAELLAAHGEAWRAGLPAWARRCAVFRRGLASHFRLTPEQLLEHGRALRQSIPCDSIDLSRTDGQLIAILEAGLLEGLRHLDLSFSYPTPDELIRLAGSPQVASLLTLDVSHSSVCSREAACALAGSPHLAGLVTLRGLTSGPALMEAVATSGLARLKHLDLGGLDVPAGPVVALFSSSSLPALERLRLAFCRIGPQGQAGLARASGLAGLRQLSLHVCRLGDEGASGLAASPCLRNVTSLSLVQCSVGPEGARALAGQQGLERLTRLDLSHNPLGDLGLAALARSGHLSRLARLDLSSADVTDEGLMILARSPLLSGLTAFRLFRSRMVTRGGVEVLAASPGLAGLRELDLGSCSLGSAGAAALARSPYLGGLVSLSLGGSGIGPDGVEALAGSATLTSLRRLDLGGNQVCERGARALITSPLAARLSWLRLERSRVPRPLRTQLRSQFGERLVL